MQPGNYTAVETANLFQKEDMLLSESESSLALYKKCADFKDRQTKTMFSLKVDNDLHFVSMYPLEQGHPSEANDTLESEE